MSTRQKSAGFLLDKKTARYERQAWREFLDRLKKSVVEGGGTAEEIRMVSFIREWVLKRRTRYGKAKGGL